MKKLTIAVIPSPGLLNHDLKGMQTPAERLMDALRTLLVILAPVFKIVAYFATLVLVFATMFALFVMASTVQEPKEPTTIIIMKGEPTHGTDTQLVPPRI